MELRITTTTAEEHEAAKDVLPRAGLELRETRPVLLTYALTFHADLADMERPKYDLSAVAPSALVNPVETGTGRPGLAREPNSVSLISVPTRGRPDGLFVEPVEPQRSGEAPRLSVVHDLYPSELRTTAGVVYVTTL